MKVREIIIMLILAMAIGGGLVLWSQAIRERAAEIQSDKCEVAGIKWRQDHFKLNEDNLYNELLAQEVQFPEIVVAQAILETGHFKSYACTSKNNLFGLRNGNGTYMSFGHWTDAVATYKKCIQKWDDPPNDYYRYLDSLGYAKDSLYIKKVRELVDQRKK